MLLEETVILTIGLISLGMILTLVIIDYIQEKHNEK